jgi:hypothetical protein
MLRENLPPLERFLSVDNLLSGRGLSLISVFLMKSNDRIETKGAK